MCTFQSFLWAGAIATYLQPLYGKHTYTHIHTHTHSELAEPRQESPRAGDHGDSHPDPEEEVLFLGPKRGS